MIACNDNTAAQSRAIGWRGPLGQAIRAWGLHLGAHWRIHALVIACVGAVGAALGAPV